MTRAGGANGSADKAQPGGARNERAPGRRTEGRTCGEGLSRWGQDIMRP